MNKARLRELEENEIEDIARIKLNAQKVSMEYKHNIRSFEDEKEYLKKTRDRCSIWVAVINDKIEGFCAFDKNWIEQLFVDPQFYRQGIGQSLLEKTKEQTSQLSALVDSENREAIRFYESRGFIKREAIDEGESAFRYEWNR